MMTDPIRSRGHSKAVWAGALLGLVVGLPFLGKAFHIDDTHVLSITAQILQEPLDPYGFSINWTDDPEPVFKTWNPPFLSYWLAPVVSLFGYSEPILHAAMLPFLAMLGAGCVVLARRFAGGDNPPAALGVAAFVLLSPALMPSVNLMLDVPALALSAAGAALFVTGSDAGSRKRLLTGAALASLAVLTKYSAATVLPALAVYSISFRRRPDAIALIPPITLALLWTWQNFAFHGESHFLHLIGGRTSEAWIRAWPEKGLLAIAIAGSCLFLAPVIAGRSGRAWGTGIAAGGLAVAAAHLWFGGWPGTLFAIGCALGAALLALAMATLLRRGDRRESIFLGTWLLLPFLFSVFFVPFQAVRHFLPWLVPLSLIAWRAAESTNRTLRVIILGAQALVAVIVSLADYEFANVYREAADRVRTSYPGEVVWYAGHWGWQFYADNANLRQISKSGAGPGAGEIVVVPKRVHKGHPPEGMLARVRRIDRWIYDARVPLRPTIGPGETFYCLTVPALPYLLESGDDRSLETFDIYRVGR